MRPNRQKPSARSLLSTTAGSGVGSTSNGRVEMKMRQQFRGAWAMLALTLALGACGGQDPEAQAAAGADSAVAGGDSVAGVPGTVAAPTGKAPAQIRGLYINAYAAGSRTRLPKLIAMADSTEINTFVVDVKSERGVHYNTSVALAKELQQDGENTLRDLKAFVDTLHAHDIYAMARIVL